MISSLKKKYPHCRTDYCHSEVSYSIYVSDNESAKCSYSNVRRGSTLYIQNDSNVTFDFIAIDKCLIKSNKIKKCDLALHLNDRWVWFIELKEVIFNGNSSRDRNRKLKASKKAVQQLGSTINDFKSKGVDLSKLKIFTLISFPPFIDETSPISIPSPAQQARVLELSEICGVAELFEGNYIVI